jgi:tryptophan 2,3-dioxygenase
MTDLITRLEEFGDADPATFPYEDVIAAFHKLGKHFVAKELLAALDSVRRAATDPQLGRFLDCALDKYDATYNYPSYTGLPLLALPDGEDPARASRMHDRLLTLLMGDLLRFELAAADSQTELLSRMRPDERVTAKRCRLCLRVLGQRMEQLGLCGRELAASPVAAARRAQAAIALTVTPAEQRTLDLSMLPVDIVHDEYMFIRVLQTFESTFALMGILLARAIKELERGDGGAAAAGALLRECAAALHNAGPLFSLLATMQVGAFRLFREFTEGASAIQSRGYKLMEALCRPPAAERLDSAAFLNVPDVRAQVLAGLPSLQEAVLRAEADGRLPADARRELDADMGQFAGALVSWRTTHYRLAVRMLGEAPGTGYTEGTPYLKSVQRIPVFDADADAAAATGQQREEEPRS